MKDFAAGKLGIVRPALSKENQIIAFRHMEGWGLDEEAQAAVLTTPEVDSGGPGPEPDLWLKARTVIVGGEPPKIDPFTQLKDYNSYVRIPAGAFIHAAAKLEELTKSHGSKSPEVLEWIKGQDQVFASTTASPAVPAVVKGPEWLRAEREYQIAAALFYAEKFDEARKAFQAISLDKGSPWQSWGTYLQARCWVREATLRPLYSTAPVGGAGDFRRPYLQAQALLEIALKSKLLPEDVRDAAENYRDLVRHVTEPALLRDEALVQLSTPKVGGGFRAAMTRLISAEKAAEKAAEKTVEKAAEKDKAISKVHGEPINSRAESMRAWLDAFAGDALQANGASFLKEAKESHSMLVAALAKLPKGHPDEKALMALAQKVPATSPAYPTIRWQLIWLELGSLPLATQKARLEAALKRKDLPAWALNRLRIGRRSLAGSLEEWIPFAASIVVATDTENELEISKPDEKSGEFPQFFSGNEGNAINANLTLDQLLTVAKNPSLPKSVAAEVARCAWMRAFVLDRLDKAAAFTPLLEDRLKARAQSILGIQDPVDRRFEAVRLMLENPGLRFDVGTDYTTRTNIYDVKEFDSLRDNWWCGSRDDAKTPGTGPGLSFLKPSDLQQATADHAALDKIPAAQIYFGNAVMAFAEAHPDDPRLPEALHKVIAATRSPMCGSTEMTTMSKRCFNLLHKRYPKSEWTKKTKYYY